MILVHGYKVSKVICLNCFTGWSVKEGARLTELRCPCCHMTGSVSETWETCATNEKGLNEHDEDGNGSQDPEDQRGNENSGADTPA